MDVLLEHGSSSVEDCQLILVTPDTLGLFWDEVVPLLEEGKEYWEEYETLGSIFKSIFLKEKDLWLTLDDGGVFLAVLTKIETYHLQQTFRILWIGGRNLKKAFGFLEFVELMCARRGIRTVEVLGRPGWLRLLEKSGYEFHSVLLTKDISGVKEH